MARKIVAIAERQSNTVGFINITIKGRNGGTMQLGSIAVKGNSKVHATVESQLDLLQELAAEGCLQLQYNPWDETKTFDLSEL